MYNAADLDKKERRKILAIVIAATVLILILIAAIIVVATNKSARKNIGGDNNSSFTISEKTDDATDEQSAINADKESDKVSEKAKAEDNKKSSIGTISTETTTSKPATQSQTTATSDNLPSTGPEDMLYTAIVLGLLTTSVTAFVMSNKAKREI